MSIGGKDLITQLKEEVLRILKTGDPSEVYAEVTNLRLIYKGKVLVDAKSIEFYKIQNDDTIQLVPFRRRANVAPTPAPAPTSSNDGGDRQTEQEGPRRQQNGRRGPITVVTFSTSAVVGGLPRFRSGRPRHIRSQQQQQTSPSRQRRSSSVPSLTRPFNPSRSRFRLPARPVTQCSLRNFKELLQVTLRRVSTAARRRQGRNREGGDSRLADQLSTLIREAILLRSELEAEDRLPAVFAATAEDGVFSLVESKEDNEGESNSQSLVRHSSGSSVPLSIASSSDTRNVAARRRRVRSIDRFRIQAMRFAAINRLRNQRRRGFTAERPNPQIVTSSHDRGRIRGPLPLNGVLHALVVGPGGRAGTLDRPLDRFRWISSTSPRAISQPPDAPQENSGDAPNNSNSSSAQEDPAPLPSRRGRWTAPEVGSANDIFEFFRSYRGRQ